MLNGHEYPGPFWHVGKGTTASLRTARTYVPFSDIAVALRVRTMCPPMGTMLPKVLGWIQQAEGVDDGGDICVVATVKNQLSALHDI